MKHTFPSALSSLVAILSQWALAVVTLSCQHSALIFVFRNLVRRHLNLMRYLRFFFSVRNNSFCCKTNVYGEVWQMPWLIRQLILKSHTCTYIHLVRGTPTAGVLIHWVIISRRWERIQQRDSESPINTDSPRKEKCCDALPGREITGPQNTQNWHHFTRTSSSTHSNYLCLLTLLHLVLLSSFSM